MFGEPFVSSQTRLEIGKGERATDQQASNDACKMTVHRPALKVSLELENRQGSGGTLDYRLWVIEERFRKALTNGGMLVSSFRFSPRGHRLSRSGARFLTPSHRSVLTLFWDDTAARGGCRSTATGA